VAASHALILTEWKIVKKPADSDTQAAQALKQANRYAAGIFAGFELTSRRYLILVSSDHLPKHSVRRENDVEYEYVNIAVEPREPSVRSKRT
jgi:hypothetical protein